MEGQLQMVLIAVGILLVLGIAAVIVLIVKRTAYLGPVKEELQKEKAWLRRGEYNAAMVKGRQNLELLLKLVAEKNGIQLDNTVQAQANARELEERQSQNPRSGKKQKTKSVMTHKEFNRWMTENGYLDRVARWEMHQVRQIGNKAVHENYSDKEDAWNQFNYLEDILKVVTEKSQSPSKRTERNAERKNDQMPKKQEQSKKKAPKKQEQPKAKKETQKKEKAAPAAVTKAATPAAEVNGEQAAAEHVKKKRRRRRPKKKAPSEAMAVEVKKEQSKQKDAPKKQEQPKAKKDAPKKQEAAEQAKKKRRRRRPKKKAPSETVAVEVKNEQTKQKTAPKQKEQPKQKEAPKKQEQPKKEPAETKKNNNQYWRRRRKKKSSRQAGNAGSGGQE